VTDDEMVAVEDLPPVLRVYVKRTEEQAGRISLRVLRVRQRGAEGRVLADARQHGTPLFVAERTSGEQISTTAAAALDTGLKVRTR
jgi:hypothetical protein